ncbi:MAG TPA: SDR family oxidoreductase [Alphaproteobacteria bacterium]|jgi:short-subunit dehydrogenase|nr:SDR family oxidoreductase [Alphaproteobacteria bacterium]
MGFFGPRRPVRGRVAVVTGASAGVGRAVAHRFASEGCLVGLIARDAAALADVEREIAETGGRAMAVAADVADSEAVFNAARTIEDGLGPIDVWVNNAMLTVYAPVMATSADEFRRVTEVTYLGYVHGTMAALRHMRTRNRGTIIQVGSALAYRSIPLQAAYCGAKHAIVGFTDALRSELMHDRSGIDVTVVHLPAVNTPQFDWARTHMSTEPRPLPPVTQPERIADAIFGAALRPRREYWVGWSTVEAILGNMVAPGFLDRYLASRGYEGEATGRPVAPGRRDNLTAPVHALHRTHGSFNREARASAPAFISADVRGVLAVAAAGLVALLAAPRLLPKAPKATAPALRLRARRALKRA